MYVRDAYCRSNCSFIYKIYCAQQFQEGEGGWESITFITFVIFRSKPAEIRQINISISLLHKPNKILRLIYVIDIIKLS